MIEFLPVDSNSPEASDFEALERDYDWHINVPTNPETAFRDGLDVLAALRKLYNPCDIATRTISMDPDTLHLTYAPGNMGMYIRKGAERIDQHE